MAKMLRDGHMDIQTRPNPDRDVSVEILFEIRWLPGLFFLDKLTNRNKGTRLTRISVWPDIRNIGIHLWFSISGIGIGDLMFF